MIKTASNYYNCNINLGFGPIQGKAMYDALNTYGCDYGGSKTNWENISTTSSVATKGNCAQKYYVNLTPSPTFSPTS